MKPRIDHTNYEAWLLDRLEGRLTPEDEKELQAFLVANPHLRPDEEPLPVLDVEYARLARFDKEGLKRVLPPHGVIDEHSLDDYLVARLEGDLGVEQSRMLDDFLSAHPEFALQERLMKLAKLHPEAVAFPDPQSLRRAIPPVGEVSAHTLDDYLVARLEGDLSAEQEAALSAFLDTHVDARVQWSLMERLRFRPEQIAFPDKASLKRRTKVIPLFSGTVLRWAAAAAVLVMVMMAWWFGQLDQPEMAQAPAQTREVMTEPHATPQDSDREPRPLTASSTDGTMPQGQRADSVARTPRRSPEPAPQPMAPNERAPMELPLAQQEPEKQDPMLPVPQPLVAHQPTEPALAAESTPINAAHSAGADSRTLGEALAGVLRERVLDKPADERRALDATDAVAAVDRSLKAVGGREAGLSVQRDGQGKQRGFSLRLGRNLAFTASR